MQLKWTHQFQFAGYYQAIQQGASGVDMGRNIFQCDAPVAMIQAVRSVVHNNETPARAYELYLSIKENRRNI